MEQSSPRPPPPPSRRAALPRIRRVWLPCASSCRIALAVRRMCQNGTDGEMFVSPQDDDIFEPEMLHFEFTAQAASGLPAGTAVTATPFVAGVGFTNPPPAAPKKGPAAFPARTQVCSLLVTSAARSRREAADASTTIPVIAGGIRICQPLSRAACLRCSATEATVRARPGPLHNTNPSGGTPLTTK